MTEVIIGIVALVLGVAVGYLWASLKAARTGGDSATSQLRTDLALEHARAEALEERVNEVTRASREREELIRAEAQQRITDLREAHEALHQQFKGVAAEVLESSTKTLMANAEERFKRAQQANDAELAKREESVKNLIEPMAKALDDVKRQTTEADKARAETESKFGEQVRQLLEASERLGKETSGLKTALRRPEIRGRWGELHLRRVVEVAGLVNQVDFVEQPTGTDEDGRRLRPDMIVTLAGGRTIVVDAKTSIDAILDLEEDGVERDALLGRHVDNVRKRVSELKSKSYNAQFDSQVEFIVLFMPAESFLQLALEHDPRLQEWAYDQGVVIATPTILVALLRTVAHAWREDQLAENAREVLTTGKELYDRLTKMGDHLARVGKAIDQAGKAYNDTIGTLERRVLPSARKFGQLQQRESNFATTAIDTEVRQITAVEMTEHND